MNRNICSGCGFNFATLDSFEKHRTGDYEAPASSKSLMATGRRCLTPDEMRAMGWTYSEPLMTFYREGSPYQKNTPTWACPVSEKRQEHFAQLSAKRKARNSRKN